MTRIIPKSKRRCETVIKKRELIPISPKSAFHLSLSLLDNRTWIPPGTRSPGANEMKTKQKRKKQPKIITHPGYHSRMPSSNKRRDQKARGPTPNGNDNSNSNSSSQPVTQTDRQKDAPPINASPKSATAHPPSRNPPKNYIRSPLHITLRVSPPSRSSRGWAA